MTFIVLTLRDSEKRIAINTKFIKTFVESERGGTLLVLSKGSNVSPTYNVSERFDMVKELIFMSMSPVQIKKDTK